MAEIVTRRSFLRVLTGLIAAPAVIQFTSLMPLRGETLIVPQLVTLEVPGTLEITGFARVAHDWAEAVTNEYIYRDGRWPAEVMRYA